MDKDVLLSILKRANFSSKFIQYIKQNFPSDYRRRKQSPFVENYLENPLLEESAYERMMESLAQLLHLKQLYQEKDIPLVHLYKSIYDVNYRINRYFKQEGVYGLSERDIRWLTPIYRAEIFDLLSLRFQISHFSYAEIERSRHEYMPLSEKWKKKIPEGTPIITIHIMKNADISPEKVKASFQEAVQFFENYFPEHEFDLFVCRTWLLYEGLQDLLPKRSNIISFAKNFTIIASNRNAKQALERIYGTSNLKEIKQLKKSSSLEKLAYKKLDRIGEAAGIIDKSTIM